MDDEFEHEGQIFSLDYRTISGDVSLPENAFRTQDFLPHGEWVHLWRREVETKKPVVNWTGQGLEWGPFVSLSNAIEQLARTPRSCLRES